MMRKQYGQADGEGKRAAREWLAENDPEWLAMEEA